MKRARQSITSPPATLFYHRSLNKLFIWTRHTPFVTTSNKPRLFQHSLNSRVCSGARWQFPGMLGRRLKFKKLSPTRRAAFFFSRSPLQSRKTLTRTCVAAYCSEDVPGQCVWDGSWMSISSWSSSTDYSYYPTLVGFHWGEIMFKRCKKKKKIDTIEKTQSTCWFWVLDNPAFAISYSVHNVCIKNEKKKQLQKGEKKKRPTFDVI